MQPRKTKSEPHHWRQLMSFEEHRERGYPDPLNVRFGSKVHLHCNTLCPLYPQERTCAVQRGMSAKGQKRGHRQFYSITSLAVAMMPGGNGQAESLSITTMSATMMKCLYIQSTNK